MLVLTGRFIYNAFFHPLARFPGPRLYGASNLPRIVHAVQGNAVVNYADLHDEYGPVVRVAPNELSYCSAQAWNDIYGPRPGQGQMPKYGGPENNSEGFGRLNMINATIADHSRMRRLVAHAFSDKAMRAQEPIIQEYVDVLMKKLEEREGQDVDICAWLNYTTFDLTGDLAFGETFNCLTEAAFNPWVSLIFNNLKMMVYGNAARLIPGLSKLLMKLAPKEVIEQGIAHMELCKEKANKRLAATTDRPDIMSYIIKHNEKETGMSLEEIQAQSYVIIIGGSETTATALSGAVYFLCSNPDTMQELQKEIRAAFTNEKDITFTSVSQLKYLLAVLNESLRMYPPVPGNFPREVPKTGAMVDGLFVPSGSAVGVCQWAANHSAANFRDPYAFHPERWTGEEKYAADTRDAFQPFSVGPRNCVGKNLAYMEMRLILARLLFNFNVELCAESNEWSKQRVFMLWEKGPLKVRLTKRK